MTDKTDSKERANFEAWYITSTRASLPSAGDGWSDDQIRDSFMGAGANGEYRSSSAQIASEGWMARASLAANAGSEPVAWTGGEKWEQLAWHLCAEEHGEDACDEVIWEGGPIPEPWGARWMKYESDAKRMIELVRRFYANPSPPEGMVGGWIGVDERLPDLYKRVLVITTDADDEPYATPAHYNGPRKFLAAGGHRLDPVTHWQEIDAPPVGWKLPPAKPRVSHRRKPAPPTSFADSRKGE